MPRIIDYGPPHGRVSYPDDVPDQQILEDISAWETSRSRSQAPEIPVESYIQQIPGEAVRGFADTLATVPEGAALRVETIGRRTPGGFLGLIPGMTTPAHALELAGVPRTATTQPLADILRAEGGLLRRTGRAITPPPVPELEQSFIASKVPRGIGSAGAFIAGGLAGGVVGAPAWLSGITLGSLSGGKDFYDDAKAHGADESTAEIASLLGNVVGTSEAVPVAQWVNRINKATGGTFLRGLLNAGVESFEEAVQESAQNIAQNFTAQQLYDKDRALFRDLQESAGVGGVTGFIVSALSSALGARQRGQQYGQEIQPTTQGRATAPPATTVTPPPIPTGAEPPGIAAPTTPGEVGVTTVPTAPPQVNVPGTVTQPDLIPGLPPPGPPPLPTETTAPPPVPPGQLELEQYATRPREEITPPGPQEGLLRQTPRQVRLRNIAQNRLEAEAGAPVVPATPAEERTPVLAEIRRANARTIAQIQQLFPQAQLNRAQARQLRDQAFPEAVYGIGDPEKTRDAVSRIIQSGAKSIAEIQTIVLGITPEQARQYRDLAYPNAQYGIYEPTLNIAPDAKRRIAWMNQLHDLGPGTPSGRWEAIENTYIAAKAADEAVPDAPFKDIIGITIRKGPYPNSPVVDHYFVERSKSQALSDSLREKYKPGEFTQQIEPGFEPHKPRKGEPQFREWLAGKRPAIAAPAQQVFESRVAGTPAPFRPEQLMGPFGFRSVAILNQLGPMTGQQMLGTLRNSIPPSEFNALQGLPEFLASKPRVTPQEVQQWISQNGPKVEAKVLRAGEGNPQNELMAALTAEQAGLRHEVYDDLPERVRISVDYYLREYMEDPDSADTSSWLNQAVSDYQQHVGVRGRGPWTASELRSKLERYALLASELQGYGPEEQGFNLSDYDFLTPIANAEHIAVMVRVPTISQQEYLARNRGVRLEPGELGSKDYSYGIYHKGGHFGPEDINNLGWSRIQYVDRNGKKTALIVEQQDDLIDKDSSGRYYFTGQYWQELPGDKSLFRAQAAKEGRNATQPRFDSFNEANEALVRAWPITKDRQRMALKAAIDQAIKDGAQSIVISDAETAMMTEGHDFAARVDFQIPATEKNQARAEFLIGLDPADQRIGQLTKTELNRLRLGEPIKVTGNSTQLRNLMAENWEGASSVSSIEQAPGMRLNYDTILPKIAEELTGVRGKPVDLGPHQRAFTNEPDRANALQLTNLVPRSNLIFRNPDGTPKTSTTGREYDLTKVKAKLAREGGFTLFGSDRISTAEQSRIEGRTELAIGTTAVEQYLRENYGLPVQAQVVVRSEPTAQWDARSIFENGQLIRIELNAANISSLEQIDLAIEHEMAHAVELSGEVANALSLLDQTELDAITADMARLGYETGDRNEFDARGVDALAQAWKGRNWFERIVGVISELASRIGLPMSRLAAERAAARAVARQLKGKAEPFRQSVSGTFESRVEQLPLFFQTPEQVQAAKADPLLQAYQRQQLDEIAAVQSSMVNDDFMSWYSSPAADQFNQIAKNILEYIANRRNLSDVQQLYGSLPSTTAAEKAGKEAVGAIILAHYGVDRATENKINSDIDKKLNQLVLANAKLPKMNQQNMKAHFLTALFNRLTADHRTYLVNLSKNEPAAQNLKAQFNQRLTEAQNRLNVQEQAPGTLQRALSALAVTVPDTLLLPGTANSAIIQWALNNGALSTVVPQSTIEWMLVDDGSGQPALESYTRLVQDLGDLRDVLTKQQDVQNDIDAYEQWFSAAGATGKIPPKRMAENYFKFRTARDRAARIAGAIEKEIGDLDTELRGLVIARDRLQSLISSPDYVETVTQAAEAADVVVRAVHNQANPLVGVGLIDRVSDEGGAFWRLQVPEGNVYIVDLYPNRSQEDQNVANLGAYVSEARAFAAAHGAEDPLLAAEHTRIADYIERFLLHPSLNPEQGFSQIGRLGIPGTSIKINISSSPFDWLSSLTGLAGFPFNTVRDAMERIGGRVTRQMMKDAYDLDTVMKKVEGIDNNKKYGFAAQTQATLKALASHKWGPDQFGIWDEEVAEPVLAAGQTIGPKYNVGDYIIGSGVKLTKEDVAALNLMKEWQDAIRAVAPAHIREQLADLYILRKAVGFGRYTMSRTSQEWTPDWVRDWTAATTPVQQLALLNKNENFRRVVMGYMGEFNPEFALMNNASGQKSPLFLIYRRLAETEKSGVQQFKNTDEILDFIANEMVSRNTSPDYVTARAQAETTLLSEIDQFTKAFNANVLNATTDSIWGAVPKPVVDVSTAKNTFTTPRGPLQAPSSFYSYSVASDARRQMHVGSLRSLMNLKLLQSMEEARAGMQAKKQDMDDEIDRQIRQGKSKAAAKKTVVKESKRLRKLNEIQHDYEELVRVLKIMENVSGQLRDYEQSSPSHYQHAGMEAMNAAMGTMKSGLLSSVQAVITNTFGGLYLGPAIFHWQTGEHLRALRDILPSPVGGTASIISPLFKMISSAVANDPVMKKVLNTHLPLFKQLAQVIVQQSDAWKRIQRIAETSGMVSPYNLRDQWRNRTALPGTGGRFGTEKDASTLAMAINSILSGRVFPETAYPRLGRAANIAIGARPGAAFAETIRAVFPRKFDDFINYALVMAFDRETEFLKKRGYEAFQAREASAATSGRDYKNLSDKDNILGPEELDLGTYQALERYRQIFAPLGSLDRVLLDFYERTKGMTPDQREAEPLIPDENEHAGLALYYASISNPATETNRPLAFKRKGSSRDAILRSTVGTFMGWVTNMMHQLSKGFQSHSKDPPSFRRAFVTLCIITILLAAVGAWNWELGDEITKFVTDVSSARIQPGNIQDVRTGMAYVAQALVNTVPVAGPIIGSVAGVAFTGRGNPFDMTSQILYLNLASDTYNTFKRMVQTKDPILPWADWTRRWVFPSFTRSLLNRLPYLRGLIDQQNAVRSLNASAPPGTEIKWGQARGGEARYSPANDEIARVINAAYNATAHGGDVADVRIALENAVQAYIRAGRSRADAEKAVNIALAGKEPIRILTGREMTPEEEVRWVGRMTAGQKADYDKAVAAWRLLGSVTGRDLGFVNQPSGGGGGGGGRIAGLPATLPRAAMARPPSARPPGIRNVGLLRAPSGGLPTLRIPRGTGRVAGIRPIRPSRGRLRRPGLRRPRLRRAAGPRVSVPKVRQRRITAGRRRR